MAQDIFASSPDLDLRKRWALMQLQGASDVSPVRHPLQAVARALQGAMGGYMAGQTEAENKANADKMFDAVMPAAQPTTTLVGNNPDYGSAIAGIESGGNYSALGPVTKTGDRAYGKYQVMGANVGPWSKQYLGQEMTPDQFLKNPQAQDAVFKGQFGQYANKYGPEGAARAWFAGEGGMNNLGAKDQLGTTVAQYGQRFAQAAQPAGRTQQQIPAEVQGQIQRLRAIGSPQANQAAWQLLFQYNKPTDRFERIPGGQRSTLTGEIKADPTRSEYTYQKQDDGSIVAVNKNDPNDVKFIDPPGGTQRQVDFAGKKSYATTRAEAEAKRDVAKPDKDKQEQKVANIAVEEIDRAIKTIDNATLPTTGMVGGMLSNVGGTAARDVAGLLDTVKANAGFEELSKMRAASPTGGALGSITEKELALLQATIGNLEQSQSEQQLKDNLRRVKNTYLDIIHGPGNGPAREKLMFKEAAGDGWIDMGGGVRIREKK